MTVAYAWHPWHGRSVRAHEVVERATGSWARCGLAGADAARLREIPAWMLDASVCRSMRKSAAPVAALSALAALRALLSEVMASAAAGSVPFGKYCRSSLDFPPVGGGVRSERHAAERMAIPSMLARASAGVR